MPSKAKNKAKTQSQKLNNSSTEQDEVLIQETEGESNMASPTKWRESLEDLIARCFRQQSDLLTDLMLRHYKLYKQEIDKIKKSQDFISTNFNREPFSEVLFDPLRVAKYVRDNKVMLYGCSFSLG